MTGLCLVHYSAEPVGAVYSVKQPGIPHFKPSGLWVSIEGEDGWEEWCEGAQFGLERLACIHDVVLKPSANILRISNAAELDDFDAEYRSPIARDFSYFSLNWTPVAEKYQGIVIAPYIWGRRLNLDFKCEWYYAWDCASGCIWAADAIESVTLRDRP